MPARDLNGPVTVINRFTVKGDIEAFEHEFRAHSQFLRRQEEFAFLVTVQLIDRPEVFVHMGHWKSLSGFQQVVHDETFLKHVQRLGSMVEARADQAVSVGRVLRREALRGAANVVLTHAEVVGDHREFEKRYLEMAGYFDEFGGFGGSDLMRSTVSPATYLGLSWWYDADSCDRALDSAGCQEYRIALADTADITTERTRHIAYESVTAA
ncbi:antibiotic biosynthesis monooxygenase family protein [Kitasatospora sp. NPDC101183]|uniref:antibiotic biosynthesis monooxygenase family protein n=1 Tax=Kitasatospora sp. NPDC101183 TaxID=3364100 RepID=UPI0038263BE6